jgi:hypothetical protein
MKMGTYLGNFDSEHAGRRELRGSARELKRVETSASSSFRGRNDGKSI